MGAEPGGKTTTEQLRQELDRLAELQGALGKNEARDDEGFRRELTALRREAWETIFQIQKTADQYFRELGNTELYKEFKTRFQHMKDAVFDHQAKWRGLDVDHNSPSYQESVRKVIKANKEFTGWAKTKF